MTKHPQDMDRPGQAGGAQDLRVGYDKSFDEGVAFGSGCTCWESLAGADRSKRFNDARNKLIEAAERWERFATGEWGVLVEDEREIGRNFGPNGIFATIGMATSQ